MAAMAYGQNHKISHDLLTCVQFKEITVLCSYGKSSSYCTGALGLAKTHKRMLGSFPSNPQQSRYVYTLSPDSINCNRIPVAAVVVGLLKNQCSSQMTDSLAKPLPCYLPCRKLRSGRCRLLHLPYANTLLCS